MGSPVKKPLEHIQRPSRAQNRLELKTSLSAPMYFDATTTASLALGPKGCSTLRNSASVARSTQKTAREPEASAG
jgi:hypothetical protein